MILWQKHARSFCFARPNQLFKASATYLKSSKLFQISELNASTGDSFYTSLYYMVLYILVLYSSQFDFIFSPLGKINWA